ncbi:MAG: hypothetical protein ACHQ1H_04840 [Nitrososphaerales archaeon]
MGTKDKSSKDPRLAAENEAKKKARDLSTEEIDRELAELSFDIGFLEEQVKHDMESYSTKGLKDAHDKIAVLKRKAQIFEMELRRKNSSDTKSAF